MFFLTFYLHLPPDVNFKEFSLVTQNWFGGARKPCRSSAFLSDRLKGTSGCTLHHGALTFLHVPMDIDFYESMGNLRCRFLSRKGITKAFLFHRLPGKPSEKNREGLHSRRFLEPQPAALRSPAIGAVSLAVGRDIQPKEE